LSPEDFVGLLPMLRRSLSAFDSHQRRAVREAVARGCRSADGHAAQEASPIFAEAVPLLMRIIGIEAGEKAA
jgi:hypothetical protein